MSISSFSTSGSPPSFTSQELLIVIDQIASQPKTYGNLAASQAQRILHN